jgi:hypothetical protein
MPFEVTLDKRPAGYLASVNAAGEAQVIVREFVSSEDGELFISRLEGFPSMLISLLPIEANITPGMVENLIAVIRRDNSASVYVNEVGLVGTIRFGGRRNVNIGDPIFEDDILDVEKLSFEGVNVPSDCGIIFVLSAGWRKGMFYDLAPLTQPDIERDYNLEVVLGRYYAYLSFQHLFKITTDECALFAQQWFPFSLLKSASRKQMLKKVKNQLPVDDLLDTIAVEVKEAAIGLLERWKHNPIIAPNIELIHQAVTRYLEDDYISSTSILYPQIEGVMRRIYYANNPPQRVQAAQLATHTVQSRPENYHEWSLLLPLKFNDYLRNVYFAGFAPTQRAVISRNSIAHGVADPKDYSLKAATIGLLTLDQIYYFLPGAERKVGLQNSVEFIALETETK